MDSRIGSQFLKAGIGYGGSCFPKDTKALVQIAGNVEHEFHLLKSVIEVNNRQRIALAEKVIRRFGSIEGRKIAVLGLAFKPETDDMREAASIVVADFLVKAGAQITAYDPVAMDNAQKWLNREISYADSIEAAIAGADCALILTDWRQFKQFDLYLYRELMKEPVIFDGRNCCEPKAAAQSGIEYHSIGRKSVIHGIG